MKCNGEAGGIRKWYGIISQIFAKQNIILQQDKDTQILTSYLRAETMSYFLIIALFILTCMGNSLITCMWESQSIDSSILIVIHTFWFHNSELDQHPLLDPMTPYILNKYLLLSCRCNLLSFPHTTHQESTTMVICCPQGQKAFLKGLF